MLGIVPDHDVASNRHGAYAVPRASRHRPASRVILASRVWEPGTIDLLSELKRDADLIHAGAFFGDFIPALARSRTGPAVVWAFEPSRDNYRCAELTVRLNGLTNVRLFRAALGEAAGTATLETSDSSGTPLGGASRIVEAGSGKHHETVEQVAIDDVVDSNREVAAIHLDVEGQERQALLGAMRTIERCRPLLVLEYLPAPSWIVENLMPLGYAQTKRVDDNFILCSD